MLRLGPEPRPELEPGLEPGLELELELELPEPIVLGQPHPERLDAILYFLLACVAAWREHVGGLASHRPLEHSDGGRL